MNRYAFPLIEGQRTWDAVMRSDSEGLARQQQAGDEPRVKRIIL